MRIISVILTFIGFVLCGIGSFGVRYMLYKVLEGLKNSETAGIGELARGFDNAVLLSYLSIFGCVIIFIGLILNFISMFTEKKRQAI